ncbi:MAG: hypothetical protein MUP86_03315 [Dehalococcoidia bacterium]|nr:hypothetical protein [Dehalococcoidia bacterium]
MELTPRERKAQGLVEALAVADEWRSKFARYKTSAASCECPDWLIRGIARHQIEACKHQLAFRLLQARDRESKA